MLLLKGNGVLVLTTRELWFSLALPEKEYAIDLKSIQKVDSIQSPSIPGQTTNHHGQILVFYNDPLINEPNEIKFELPQARLWEYLINEHKRKLLSFES